MLENLNLDSITQSSSSTPNYPNKPISPRKINMPTVSKPIFNKAPLQVNVDRPLQATNSEPFSSDSYLSQQQECSSNHSDDNSILSPVQVGFLVRVLLDLSWFCNFVVKMNLNFEQFLEFNNRFLLKTLIFRQPNP